MYSLSQLRRAFDHPRIALYELNRLYHRRGYTRACNERGTAVLEEDWDSLVVLDACRYDTFERHNTLPGELSRRESRGSNTVEFLRGNFAGRELLDTVYVTANPQFRRHHDDLETTFHAVVDVWREDGWHEELGTVLPETTTEYGRRAAERYPEKRLIVHYMQPHYPFVDAERNYDGGQLEDPEDGTSFWRRMRMNELELPVDRLREAYADNLKLALPHVRELLATLDGRSVVTADHGNMFGERCVPIPIRGWGHPQGIYTEELVSVPWLVRATGSRRTVTADPPDEPTGLGENGAVRERLRQLGYAE